MKKLPVFLIIAIVILGLGVLFESINPSKTVKRDQPSSSSGYKVRLTIPTGKQNQVSTVLAVEKGFFKKNNLDVEVVRAEKNTAAILISGKADAAVANPQTYLAAAAQGAPLVWVAGLTNNNQGIMLSNKENPKDIRVVGMQNSARSKPGVITRLKSINLDPSNMTFQDLASEDALFTAFKSKKVDFMSVPKMNWLLFAKRNNLTSADYKLLGDAADDENPTFNGLVVQSQLLKDHQDVVENLAKSLAEAEVWMKNNRDEAATIFGKFAEMPADDAAIYIDGTIEDTKDLQFTPTMARGEKMINFLSVENPDIRNYKLENYVFTGVADSLKKSGFLDQNNLK